MSPEFRRNVWLELTPRRLVTMTVILALIFIASAVSDIATPASAATAIYYFIVVFWGARNSALSVVDEIRDRTWDLQRLSALSAAQMVSGKLFGATIFNWYGGAICLAVILAVKITHDGVAAGVLDLVYFLVIGVIAQSAALLASLVAILRRQAHTRLEVFAYQMVGVLAAIATFNVWNAAAPKSLFITRLGTPDFILWWGQTFNAQVFLLASLAIFALWTLTGNYRLMRVALKVHNGPAVWLAFLAFMGIYVAGFDAWLPNGWRLGAHDTITLRLALAASTYAAITYAMVLLEPKDRVLYRRLGVEILQRKLAHLVRNLQSWMMAYIAAFVGAALLILWLAIAGQRASIALVVAAAGFLTRDVAIFVLLQTLPGSRRGDFAAVVALFALYVLAPAIVEGLNQTGALLLFFPRMSEPAFLSPLIAWIEAVILVSFGLGRISRRHLAAAA